jgi:FtsZ-interacting cell division protein ZipA
MVFQEGAIVVGGISIITLVITKLKCYAKKNGSCNYGCGFTDKSLINDDETEIKTLDLGESVHVLYVKNKHHKQPHKQQHHQEYETEYESEDENVEESCCFKTN